MSFIQDKDGYSVSFEPSRKYPVDFTDEGLFSRSAIASTGYFDVPTELAVPYAFVVTPTAGNLKVELAKDPEGSATLLYFKQGKNDYKVRKIWYVADNDFDAFTLVYSPSS